MFEKSETQELRSNGTGYGVVAVQGHTPDDEIALESALLLLCCVLPYPPRQKMSLEYATHDGDASGCGYSDETDQLPIPDEDNGA